MLVEKLASREWHSIARRYQILCVRTIEEIRHARLLELLASKDFPTVQALADKIGRSNAQVSQWKNRSERRNKAGEVIGLSNIDSASARLIEREVGKAKGWMDNDPAFDSRAVTVQPPRGSGEPHVPDFDAQDVSQSEWSLLNDLRVMPEEELAQLRLRAARNRENVDRIIAQRQAAAQADKITSGPSASKKRGEK